MHKDNLPSKNKIIELIKCQDNFCKHIDEHAESIRNLIKGKK